MPERLESIQLRAPAKINLSFRIIARRPDGFHEIETLMAPVSLFDELTITRGSQSGSIELTCDDPSLPTGRDNLVVQAAHVFLAKANLSEAWSIHLEKRIPHGAGLGGGSSDAAAVLLGLSKLSDVPLTLEQLVELAAAIGSDVPFFLYEGSAGCRGRGELISPIALPQALKLLLLKPAFGVQTPWAYSRWKDSHALPGIRYEAQRFGGLEFVNDLERPVFEKHLFLAQMKSWLLAQSEVGAAMLSGSGSTVLAALRDGGDAKALATRALAELDPELWSCVCETV